MNAQVFTTTRSASSAEVAGAVAVRHEDPDELVRVDPVLRAAQGLQPVPLFAHVFSLASRARPSADARDGRRYEAGLAEREGFEPSDRVSPVNSLAVSPIRPLSHLSNLDFCSVHGWGKSGDVP